MTKQELYQLIVNNVYTNNLGLITGARLQYVLLELLDYASSIGLLTFDDEDTPKSDGVAYSALRADKEAQKLINTAITALTDVYLSKKEEDTAQKLIRFLGGAEFGDFLTGMFAGRGGKIDTLGNAELESIKVRGAAEFPELIFNRMTVVGDEIIFTENGTIESEEELATNVYQLNMRLQDGELIAFKEHDLLKGIFHHANGFASSYMTVTEVGQTFMKVTTAAPEDTPTGSNVPPKSFMKIARVGNAVDVNRQRYIVASSKLGGLQVFDGCSTFLNGTIVGSMDTEQSFKNKYPDLPLREGMFYLYAAGLVVQDIIRVDYQGVTVREVYDRGLWQEGVTYYNNDTQGTDDVWHLGCRWRCFSDSTTDEPSWTSQHWVMIEGRSDAWMDFDSSNGTRFTRGSVDTVLTPIVYIGNTNVSTDIVEEQWSWTRESADSTDDIVWNAGHIGQRQLHLTNEDMGEFWSRANPVRFTCTAIYPASVINKVEKTIII